MTALEKDIQNINKNIQRLEGDFSTIATEQARHSEVINKIEPFLIAQENKQKRLDVHMEDLATLIKVAKWILAFVTGLAAIIAGWQFIKTYILNIIQTIRYFFP